MNQSKSIFVSALVSLVGLVACGSQSNTSATLTSPINKPLNEKLQDIDQIFRPRIDAISWL